jgi:hypothetical protein
MAELTDGECYDTVACTGDCDACEIADAREARRAKMRTLGWIGFLMLACIVTASFCGGAP